MIGKQTSVAFAMVVMMAAETAFARGPWRASEGNTTGWHLMSPEERIEHQTKIRGFKSYDACHAYQIEHHQLMASRASAQGLPQPGPGRDFCEHLRPPTSNR